MSPGCQININQRQKTPLIKLDYDEIKLDRIRCLTTTSPQSSSSSSSHASIEETGKTAFSPSRRDSRNHVPALFRLLAPKNFPASTEEGGSPTAETGGRGFNPTKI